MPNSQSRTPVDAVAEVCADLIREGRSFRYDADTCTIVMLTQPISVAMASGFMSDWAAMSGGQPGGADLIRRPIEPIEQKSRMGDTDWDTMNRRKPTDLDLIKLSMGHADPEKARKEEVANLYTRTGEWAPPSEIVRTCTARGLAELHARGLLMPREFPTPLEIKPENQKL